MPGINIKLPREKAPPTRRIEGIYLFGWRTLSDAPRDVAEAIAYIESFDESKPCPPFTRYEVGVRYSNGNEIRGQFNDKPTAVAFLRRMW